ncbi:hypothetical protein FISHEDRAFT_72139 [Fistulina hepatica ATCC 64428]|uniref:Uncharacterized protein n=1 Tax=Fistulina hepatica ATCC 64428 TaxID=1128425 RepID=A0A0D7AEW5_9AGAR|nr:hypothetical protein FISHEDRAFT_72139 [Fistulina hepatica ATCC 64428]
MAVHYRDFDFGPFLDGDLVPSTPEVIDKLRNDPLLRERRGISDQDLADIERISGTAMDRDVTVRPITTYHTGLPSRVIVKPVNRPTKPLVMKRRASSLDGLDSQGTKSSNSSRQRSALNSSERMAPVPPHHDHNLASEQDMDHRVVDELDSGDGNDTTAEQPYLERWQMSPPQS